jgi:hypothetical protein
MDEYSTHTSLATGIAFSSLLLLLLSYLTHKITTVFIQRVTLRTVLHMICWYIDSG